MDAYRRLGMKRATVFAIQERIKRMLKAEVQKLTDDGEAS
jgi:hypothetical protein